MAHNTSEKGDAITPTNDRSSGSGIDIGKVENADDSFEVFKKQDGVVDFRTVGWIHASVIFLKGKLEVDFQGCSVPSQWQGA